MPFLRLLLLLLIFTVVPATDAQSNSDPVRVPALVEATEWTINAEGGYSLHVSGILGTGCEAELRVEQVVDGTTLNVYLYQEVAPDLICPMIAIGFDQTIKLDPPPGILRVRVNDSETFDLPSAQAVPVLPDRETYRAYTVIESVEVTDEGQIHVKGYQPDGCTFPVQVETEVVDPDLLLRYTIYRELPVYNACAAIIAPYDALFDAPVTPLPQYIEVNDFGTEKYTSEPLQRVLVPVLSDTPMTATQPVIVEVTWGAGEEAVCDVPVFSRVRVQRDNIFEILFYQWQFESMSCPIVLSEQTTAIPLPLDLQAGMYRYRLNQTVTGAFILKEPDPLTERSNAVNHVIDSVTPQVDGQSVTLDVVGIVPDGCETDVHTDISREGQALTVTIYRLIPPGVMCPMMIVDYHDTVDLGTLDPGDYTVTVNGVTAAFVIDS